jgi:very-short-patch-repair endonuclease
MVATARAAIDVTVKARGSRSRRPGIDLLGYEPDFLWRDRRLIVEADGFGPHSTKTAFEHDRRRDTDLFLAGFHVTRFTHDQVTKAPRDTAVRLTQLWNATTRPDAPTQ